MDIHQKKESLEGAHPGKSLPLGKRFVLDNFKPHEISPLFAELGILSAVSHRSCPFFPKHIIVCASRPFC